MMHNAKFVLLLLLAALSLLSAGIIIARSQGAEPAQQGSTAFELRAKTVEAALAQNNLFDCATYHPDSGSVLPVEQQIFEIVRVVEITPDDGKEYGGAIWSPDGNAMVFVMPTGDVRDIPDSDALTSDHDTRLVAISKNELWLYFPNQNAWDQITPDGARPTWSTDGQSIYYMMGTDLMKFDLNTRATAYAGLRAPNTGAGLLFSRPLPDGRLFAPRQPHAPLEIQGGKAPASSPIGVVADSDRFVLSPQGDQVVVGYGASESGRRFTPAVTVLHHPDGEITPLLKNCQFSALEMVWSPTGNQIAYPINTDRPEIRIYDVESGQTRVLLRLDTRDLLSGLSWSPDGNHLAFTHGDDRSIPRSIWVVSTDGAMRQRLTQGGLLPNWSPDGRHILYARPGTGRLLDWYLLEYTATTSLPQPSPTTVPTPTPEGRASEYRDTWLCFAVEVPKGWTSDGVPGGFAFFTPETGQSRFNITNVSIEEPTLTAALAEVKRGSLGPYIQEVKDFTVGGRPALWVTLSPDNPDSSGIKLVILVIAPDCGIGPPALFISATEADQGSFEIFLSHIRFL